MAEKHKKLAPWQNFGMPRGILCAELFKFVTGFMNFRHFRHIIIYAVIALVAAQTPGTAHAADSGRKFTVTLDAGHGGHDHGATGCHSSEKDITLAVVKKVGALIRHNLGKDARVVYTRDGDFFVPLQERADIANSAKSDLFISVHINSVAKSNKNRNSIEGVQVYTLGLHKTAENLAVAKRENAVMELEDDHTARYAGFDPESPESDIIFELSQNKRLDQSIEFADAAYNELIHVAGRAPRGVRQAGFWVLWATSMPAVLIELDFICNPDSEEFLTSQDGQNSLAAAIYKAVCSYINTYGPDVTGRKIAAKRLPGSYVPPKRKAPELTHEEKPARVPDLVEAIPADEGTAKKPSYRIQIVASVAPLEKDSPELKGARKVAQYREGNLYKYTVGPYQNMKKAQKALDDVRRDFPDAFIVEIQQGRRTGAQLP